MSKYFQAALSPIQDTYVNKYFQLPLGEITDLATKKQQRSDLTYAQMSKAIQDAYGLKAHKELVADVEYTKGFKRDLDAISGEMMGVEDWTDPKVRNLYDSRIRKVITDPRALTVATNYEYMAKELERQNKLSDDFKSADHRYLQFRDNLGLHNKLYNTADEVGQFTGSYQPYYDYRKEMQESMKHLKAEKTSDPKIGSMWVYVLNNERLTEDEVVRRSIGSLTPKAIEEMQVEWQYSQARQEGKSFEQYAEDKVRGQARLFTVNNQDIEGFTANRYNADRKQAEYEAELRKQEYQYHTFVTGSYEEPANTLLKNAIHEVNTYNERLAAIDQTLKDGTLPEPVRNELMLEKANIEREAKLANEIIQQKTKQSKEDGSYDKKLNKAWDDYAKMAVLTQMPGPKPVTDVFYSWRYGSETFAEMQDVIQNGVKLPDGQTKKITTKKEFEDYFFLPSLSTHSTAGIFNQDDMTENRTIVTTAQMSSDPRSPGNQLAKVTLNLAKSGPSNFTRASGGKTLAEDLSADELDKLSPEDIVVNSDNTIRIKGVMYKNSNPAVFENAIQSSLNVGERIKGKSNTAQEAADVAVRNAAVARQRSTYGSQWDKLALASENQNSKPTAPVAIAGVNISIQNVHKGPAGTVYNMYFHIDGKPEVVKDKSNKPMSFKSIQDMQEYVGLIADELDNPTHVIKRKK